MLAEERMITTPDRILSKAVFVTETVSALKHGDFICCATAPCNDESLLTQILLLRTRAMPENAFCFPLSVIKRTKLPSPASNYSGDAERTAGFVKYS